MPTTLEELQSLTNAQLAIMCHDYRITPGHVTQASRRHLERRLLMAIIAERAAMRAQDEIRREQDEQYSRELYAHRHGANTLPSRPSRPNYNLTYAPRASAMSATPKARPARRGILRNGTRNAATMTSPSVLQTGHTRWPAPVPSSMRHSYAPPAASSGRRSLPLWRYQAAHGYRPDTQNYSRGHGSERRSHGAERRSAGAEFLSTVWSQLNPEPEYEEYEETYEFVPEQPNSHMEKESQPYEAEYPPLYGGEYEEQGQYSEPDSEPDLPTDYESFSSSSELGIELATDDAKSDLKSAERLTGWQHFLHQPGNMSAERELSSFNYLTVQQQQQLLSEKQSNDDEEEKQLLELMTTAELREYSEEDADVAAAVAAAQRRPSLWRNIFSLLCCDRQGKIDAEKLRCTFLCCTMAACLFFVIRVMH